MVDDKSNCTQKGQIERYTESVRDSTQLLPPSAYERQSHYRAANQLAACPYETTFINKERRFPMFNGDRRPTLSLEFRSVATLGDKEDERITLELQRMFKDLLPKPQDIQRKQDFVEKLERLLNQEWPGKDFTVHAFGSSENMLATRFSDLDVCIETEWAGFGHQICQLSEFMARCGMQNVVCRSQAKVPVVAIYDPELKVACDMNINNMLALRNTRLVKTYMQMDERARQLTLGVKQWASKRALNEAVCNTLTSYTWTLMVINYLQTRKMAPVLPSLQEWPHEPLPPINGIDVSFADDVNKYDTLQTFSLQNGESVGSLLFGFFHHYSYEFNYHRDVASVRRGDIIDRVREKNWPSDNMFCVEEPFTTTRNLGNTADMGSHKGIHQELQRAHRLLAQGAHLSTVFAQFEASKTGAQPLPATTTRNWKRIPSLNRQRNYKSNGSRNHNAHFHHNQALDPKSGPGSAAFNQSVYARSPGYKFDHQIYENDMAQENLDPVNGLRSHYPAMSDHTRAVLNRNPYMFQPPWFPYLVSYNPFGSVPPEPMLRTKSLPLPRYEHREVKEPRRNSSPESDQSSARPALTTTDNFSHECGTAEVNAQDRSKLSRYYFNQPGNSELASKLGISQIEMIFQEHTPAIYRDDQQELAREDLLSYDQPYGRADPSPSVSDAGDSRTSAASTLSSSRSSPSSMNGFPSPIQPTYAQVFNGALEPDRKTPPSMSLTSSNDRDNTTSCHFPIKPVSQTGHPVKQETGAPKATPLPVTYAAKVSANVSQAAAQPPTRSTKQVPRQYEAFPTAVRPSTRLLGGSGTAKQARQNRI